MAIGLSKDGKWVFNKACTTPWCHAIVPTVEAHLKSKRSFFTGDLQCVTQD